MLLKHCFIYSILHYLCIRDRDFCLESDENICLLLWEKLFLIVVHSHGRGASDLTELFLAKRTLRTAIEHRWKMETGKRSRLFKNLFRTLCEHLKSCAYIPDAQKDSKNQFSLNPKNKLLFSDSQPPSFLSHFKLELATFAKIRPRGHGNTDIRQKTTNTERLTSLGVRK